MTATGKTELWRKAAVLGSLWAVSEIVLGTFLHNAHIPMRGYILTAIGIAILVAGHGLWPERGLLWRAGLVCAAMKSVSPSAVILGPMIAISMEGILLEGGVALAGANLAGYLLGGGMAMSWTMLHQMGGILLFYGPESWTLYRQGLARLCEWSGYPSSGPWTPILVVLAAHFLGGCAAAMVGRRIGRTDVAAARPEAVTVSPRKGSAPPRPAAGRAHSLSALALHALFVLAFLGAGHALSPTAYVGVGVFYSGLCVAGYGRARTILSRGGLWAGVLVAGVLAGYVMGRWDWGLRMGLRAVLLTMGFSCIGEELRNPRLVAWMGRHGAGTYFAALEQAFDALPEIVASLPPARTAFQDPARTFRDAVRRALALIEDAGAPRVLLITGGHGVGKSETVGRLADEQRRAGRSVGGIHAPGSWQDAERSGFDVVDLLTRERSLLCRRSGEPGWLPLGPYRFSPEGLRFGCEALARARRHEVDLLFVDEVGPLELRGQGWADELDALVRQRRKPMVWVVRPHLVDAVKKRWGIPDARSFEVGAATDIRVEELLGTL